MIQLCECNSWDCKLTIDVDFNTATRHYNGMNFYYISNECKTGPEPDDELVEAYEGFKLYKGKE